MSIGLLALVDDIALLADDVSVATRHAGSSAGAILGDDVAVNAEKATGFSQKRELKVIWEITKGAIKNKFIVMPFAFILSAFYPQVITFALILGGIYLLFEGGEKVLDFILSYFKPKQENKALLESTENNILEVEEKKIKSAILTDFILSIEIIIVALGAVINEPLITQIIAVSIVAIIATFGVYGTVAMIVRMDDVGFWLMSKNFTTLGYGFVLTMPIIIKLLGIVGTLAMLLVGGSILMHNVGWVQHFNFADFNILNEFIVGLILSLGMASIAEGFEIIKEKIKLSKSEDK